MTNLNINSYITKQDGDTLSANEWNSVFGSVQSKVNELVNNANTGSTGSGSGINESHISINAKGNLNIETTASDQVNGKGGKINIEPYSDLQIKPGDDITLYSHHRDADKQDEVAIKVMNGENSDYPVKLQLNAAEMTLTTKDKTGDDANVFDINVNRGKNQKGYLKVRAQAIDLRCEEHGGIALQPKGADSDGHMNKIKFEHGGGDGLEFGTFNAEKTSIFTDEYRFNKDGVWKMATRNKETSNKYDSTDETTHYKYVKAADDFYDVISAEDPTATTKDIIKTAYAFNGAHGVHSKITSKGNLEIATENRFLCKKVESSGPNGLSIVTTPLIQIADGKYYDENEVALINVTLHQRAISLEVGESVYFDINDDHWSLTKTVSDINIESAGNIKIDSQGELKLGGVLDFGSSFNFGETDNGIEVLYKYTKKGAKKDCGIIKVVGMNNHATDDLVIEDKTIAPGETSVIASCSILDIIKLVNYMKDNRREPFVS